MIYNWILKVFAVGTVVCSSASLYSAEFIPLGHLPGAPPFSDAWGVSADGGVVVGEASTGTGFAGVRWTFPGGIQRLDVHISSAGGAVSADGRVVVSSRVVGVDEEAFFWTETGGIAGLGDLAGGDFASKAYDASADGSVIVGFATSALGTEAFRWTATTGIVGLGAIPGGTYGSYATGVDADGSVVVGADRRVSGFGLGHEAFRWTAEGGMVGLGDLPGGMFHSVATDVSADGSIVVGESITALPGDYRAFRWATATGMVAIPDVPNVGPALRAEGVSGDGNVVVGTAGIAPFPAAFAWDSFHGTRSIAQLLIDQSVDLTGWQLEVARSASFDGHTIIGLGTNPNGEREGWIARLEPGTFVPEPSSIILIGTGLLAAMIGVLALRR